MLNREFMISRLTETKTGDHGKVFALRRELRALSLPDLAKRFECETGEDAYDASDAAAKEKT
jgi:hypothetical protein